MTFCFTCIIAVTSDIASECDNSSDEDLESSTGPVTEFGSQHPTLSSLVITSSPMITISPVITSSAMVISSPKITSSPVITISAVVISSPVVSRVSGSPAVMVVNTMTTQCQETVSNSQNAVSLTTASSEGSTGSGSVLQGIATYPLFMHINYSTQFNWGEPERAPHW